MRIKGSFLVVMLLLGGNVLSAQQKSVLALEVVVAPKSGAPVSDLQRSDFTVLDQKSPQQISSFRAPGQDPVHVTIVVDAVNVTFSNVAYQRGELEKFLRANGGQLAQPTQLAFFTDSGIKIQQGYSVDGNELSTSLGQQDIGLRDIRRSSQHELSDRLQLSLTAMRELIAHEAELPGRKAILWISPGWPILSGPGIELDNKQQKGIFATVMDVSNQMRQARVVLYNVNPLGAGEGVGQSLYYENFLKAPTKPEQVYLGSLSLQVLAVQSGGLALVGSNDTAAQLQNCIASTRASYQVGYTPAAAKEGDVYHHIEVRVSRPGLTARTRDGYYVQP